jgi:hypothetical protein
VSAMTRGIENSRVSENGSVCPVPKIPSHREGHPFVNRARVPQVRPADFWRA